MQKTVVWITGAKGRLGRILTAELEKDPAIRLVKSDIDVDVTDPKQVHFFADVSVPDIIVNCASVSKEEADKDEVHTYKVNALGARNLAAASRRHNAALIQLSTNEVFSRNSDMRLNEFDHTTPSTIYGRSKLAGENLVRELNPKHIIIRSSWVYDLGKSSSNPHYDLLQKLRNGQQIEARADFFSTPTSAASLAKAIHALIRTPLYGIYHAADEGHCSEYDFYKEMAEQAGCSGALVKPVIAQQENSVLENLMFKMTEITKMPEWKEDLKEQMKKYKEKAV